MSNLSKTFRYVNSNNAELIFDYSYGLMINKPTGIDTIEIDLTEAQGINQVGSTIQSASIQSRPIGINGVVCGNNQSQMKQKLLSVIRPDLTGTLYCDDFHLDVRPSETPTIGYESQFAKFSFELLAPYPYWIYNETQVETLRGVAARFKFPWNISESYRFGETQQSAFINVYNSGQTDIPFTVTFEASDAVVSPKLIDAATNNYLLLNKSLVANERVVVAIGHDYTTVVSSVDGECRGALDLGSSFYRLKPGDNVIKPTATSGLSNLDVKVEYAPEMVGVVL